MKSLRGNRKSFVAFVWLALALPGAPALAESAPAHSAEDQASMALEADLARLADPDAPDWQGAEARVLAAWSRSGSAAVDALLERAQRHLGADDAQAAISDLTVVTELAPAFAEGWNQRAIAYFAAGQIGPSLRDLGQALRLNPRNYVALAGLGTILSDTDRLDEAMAALRASLAINPHQAAVERALRALERRAGQGTI